MSKFDDKTLAVARVYTDSMLSLAESAGEAEALNQELRELAEAVDKDPQLGDFLTSPLVDQDERQKSLETMLRGRASDLLVDSLQVLNSKGRSGLIPALATTYGAALNELRKRAMVTVTTSVPLDSLGGNLRQRLLVALEKRLDRQVQLEEKVDEGLLGGLVIQAGDRSFDASVATSLNQLGETLRDRAATEIAGRVEG